MNKWLRRTLYVYGSIAALYFGLAVYIHRQDIGKPGFNAYAWTALKYAAIWPYILGDPRPRSEVLASYSRMRSAPAANADPELQIGDTTIELRQRPAR